MASDGGRDTCPCATVRRRRLRGGLRVGRRARVSVRRECLRGGLHRGSLYRRGSAARGLPAELFHGGKEREPAELVRARGQPRASRHRARGRRRQGVGTGRRRRPPARRHTARALAGPFGPCVVRQLEPHGSGRALHRCVFVCPVSSFADGLLIQFQCAKLVITTTLWGRRKLNSQRQRAVLWQVATISPCACGTTPRSPRCCSLAGPSLRWLPRLRAARRPERRRRRSASKRRRAVPVEVRR